MCASKDASTPLILLITLKEPEFVSHCPELSGAMPSCWAKITTSGLIPLFKFKESLRQASIDSCKICAPVLPVLPNIVVSSVASAQ